MFKFIQVLLMIVTAPALAQVPAMSSERFGFELEIDLRATERILPFLDEESLERAWQRSYEKKLIPDWLLDNHLLNPGALESLPVYLQQKLTAGLRLRPAIQVQGDFDPAVGTKRIQTPNPGLILPTASDLKIEQPSIVTSTNSASDGHNPYHQVGSLYLPESMPLEPDARIIQPPQSEKSKKALHQIDPHGAAVLMDAHPTDWQELHRRWNQDLPADVKFDSVQFRQLSPQAKALFVVHVLGGTGLAFRHLVRFSDTAPEFLRALSIEWQHHKNFWWLEFAPKDHIAVTDRSQLVDWFNLLIKSTGLTIQAKNPTTIRKNTMGWHIHISTKQGESLAPLVDALNHLIPLRLLDANQHAYSRVIDPSAQYAWSPHLSDKGIIRLVDSHHIELREPWAEFEIMVAEVTDWIIRLRSESKSVYGSIYQEIRTRFTVERIQQIMEANLLMAFSYQKKLRIPALESLLDKKINEVAANFKSKSGLNPADYNAIQKAASFRWLSARQVQILLGAGIEIYQPWDSTLAQMDPRARPLNTDKFLSRKDFETQIKNISPDRARYQTLIVMYFHSLLKTPIENRNVEWTSELLKLRSLTLRVVQAPPRLLILRNEIDKAVIDLIDHKAVRPEAKVELIQFWLKEKAPKFLAKSKYSRTEQSLFDECGLSISKIRAVLVSTLLSGNESIRGQSWEVKQMLLPNTHPSYMQYGSIPYGKILGAIASGSYSMLFTENQGRYEKDYFESGLSDVIEFLGPKTPIELLRSAFHEFRNTDPTISHRAQRIVREISPEHGALFFEFVESAITRGNYESLLLSKLSSVDPQILAQHEKIVTFLENQAGHQKYLDLAKDAKTLLGKIRPHLSSRRWFQSVLSSPNEKVRRYLCIRLFKTEQ